MEGYLVRKRGSGSYVAPRAESISVVDVRNRGTVALVFPHQSRFMRNVTEGFMDGVSSTGMDAITYNLCGQTDEVSEAGYLRKVVESGIAGLVVWIERDNAWTRQLAAELRGRRFPLVFVDRYMPGIDVDCVVSDNEEIGYRMTQALIRDGHRVIAFAGFSHTPPSSVSDRLSGYRRALQEASLPRDDGLLVYEEDLRETPAVAVTYTMARCERPTAFVCTHDVPASSLYHELAKLGYRVPEHCDVAMVDDEHSQELRELPFIRIAQRGYDLGRESAEVLFARINDPERPVERRFVRPETSPNELPARQQWRSETSSREPDCAVSGTALWQSNG